MADGRRTESSTNRPALRRCVGIDPSRFAAEYWSRRPLRSAATDLPTPFEDLLSLAAVDELVSRRGLRTPFVRMAKDGTVIDPAKFTRPGGAGAEIADQVADDRVLELFADGATLVLQGLHRLWPPVVTFGGQLAADLGHPVQVNAYVTPASSRGFSAHYDVHDVFVLQVHGRKRWVVHNPVHPAPLRDQPWTQHRQAVADAARGDPEIDTVLGPGDALYLPRGYLHAAQALGGVSLHLTVGVHVVTRYALVEALTAAAAGDPRLRGSLALGVDLADPDQLAAELSATVDALVEVLRQADRTAVADRVRSRTWRATRPEPLAPVSQAVAAAELSSDSRIRTRAGLRHLLRDDGERIVLELPDRRLSLPVGTKPALEALLSGAVLVVAELPGLDPADQLTLARRLLREAVAVPAAG